MSEINKEFLPVEFFREKDFDISSNFIRDYVHDKPRYGIELVDLSVDFGQINKDIESKEQTISFINNGFDTITTIKVAIIGDFILKSTLPETIKPNEFCHLKVTCKPTQIGKIVGGIYIYAFMAEGYSLVKLTGLSI